MKTENVTPGPSPSLSEEQLKELDQVEGYLDLVFGDRKPWILLSWDQWGNENYLVDKPVLMTSTIEMRQARRILEKKIAKQKWKDI